MEFVVFRYRVTAYFRDKKVVRAFKDIYDAIDFRDVVDAHYPLKVTFEKVIDMRQWVYDCWNGVMDMDKNPLRHIPEISAIQRRPFFHREYLAELPWQINAAFQLFSALHNTVDNES